MNTRRIGLLAAWLVATTASVALAYEAVDLVRDQVVERPMPVLRRAPAAQPAESETADLLESLLELEDSLSDEVPATTGATGPESTAATSPESTAATVSDTAPPPTEQPTTTTLTTPQHEPPLTGDIKGGQLEEATYRLVGGTVTIRFGFGFVEFVRAIPRSGYQTYVKKTGPKQVEVEFQRGDQVSKFKAQWVHDALDVSLKEDTGDT